jgi:hypothetical protein
MSALTPYIGALANRAIISPLNNPAVRQQLFSAGGQLSNFIMKRAANRIKRAWRSRSRRGYRAAKRRRRTGRVKRSNVGRRARMKLGDPVGSSNCKRRLIDGGSDFTDYDTRTFQINSLTTIPRGDDSNERERALINVRGVKINMMFVNKRTLGRLLCNFAIISPKDCINTVPNGDDFFRAHDQYRWKDFDSPMNSMERHLAMINTDRYLIHYHKRFQIAPNVTSSSAPNWRLIRKWIAIKRQLRYEDKADGNATEPVNGSIYVVFWYDHPDLDRSQTPTTGLTLSGNSVIYYKETGTY